MKQLTFQITGWFLLVSEAENALLNPSHMLLALELLLSVASWTFHCPIGKRGSLMTWCSTACPSTRCTTSIRVPMYVFSK